MKINEFRVDEGFLDNIHRRVTGAQTASDTARSDRITARGQQSFINTFVTTTQAAVDAGIKSGIVDPAVANRLKEDNSKYSKLNALFESLIEAKTPATDSIRSYVVRAFMQYMDKVPGLDTIKPRVERLAARVQNTYAKDRGTAALTELGNLGWAASMAMRKNAAPVPPTPPAPAPGYSKTYELFGKHYVKTPTGWMNADDGVTPANASLIPALEHLLSTSP